MAPTTVPISRPASERRNPARSRANLSRQAVMTAKTVPAKSIGPGMYAGSIKASTGTTNRARPMPTVAWNALPSAMIATAAIAAIESMVTFHAHTVVSRSCIHRLVLRIKVVQHLGGWFPLLWPAVNRPFHEGTRLGGSRIGLSPADDIARRLSLDARRFVFCRTHRLVWARASLRLRL